MFRAFVLTETNDLSWFFKFGSKFSLLKSDNLLFKSDLVDLLPQLPRNPIDKRLETPGPSLDLVALGQVLLLVPKHERLVG